MHSCVHGLRCVLTPLEATGPNWAPPPHTHTHLKPRCSGAASQQPMAIFSAGSRELEERESVSELSVSAVSC